MAAGDSEVAQRDLRPLLAKGYTGLLLVHLFYWPHLHDLVSLALLLSASPNWH